MAFAHLGAASFVFFFKQKTAYEIGTGDWSSDVCSSDLSSLQKKRYTHAHRHRDIVQRIIIMVSKYAVLHFVSNHPVKCQNSVATSIKEGCVT